MHIPMVPLLCHSGHDVDHAAHTLAEFHTKAFQSQPHAPGPSDPTSAGDSHRAAATDMIERRQAHSASASTVHAESMIGLRSQQNLELLASTQIALLQHLLPSLNALCSPSPFHGHEHGIDHTMPTHGSYLRVMRTASIPSQGTKYQTAGSVGASAELLRLTYELYLGYDAGDRLYDHAAHDVRAQLADIIPAMYPLISRVVWLRVNNGSSSTAASTMIAAAATDSYLHARSEPRPATSAPLALTSMWNELFIQAVQDGADYFFWTGDDVRFSLSPWPSSDRKVSSLARAMSS